MHQWWIIKLRTVFVLHAFKRMRPGGRYAILHMLMFLWPQMEMTFPFIVPRRWRSASLSTSKSLVTLSCIRCELAQEGWNGRRASPHPLDYWLGKTLWRGSDDLSDGWMTLHTCKWRCMSPSTPKPAWCTSPSVGLELTLKLKSWMGEVSGAQVWVFACLISFPVF
jgi:hypothetical protein